MVAPAPDGFDGGRPRRRPEPAPQRGNGEKPRREDGSGGQATKAARVVVRGLRVTTRSLDARCGPRALRSGRSAGFVTRIAPSLARWRSSVPSEALHVDPARRPSTRRRPLRGDRLRRRSSRTRRRPPARRGAARRRTRTVTALRSTPRPKTSVSPTAARRSTATSGARVPRRARTSPAPTRAARGTARSAPARRRRRAAGRPGRRRARWWSCTRARPTAARRRDPRSRSPRRPTGSVGAASDGGRAGLRLDRLAAAIDDADRAGARRRGDDRRRDGQREPAQPSAPAALRARRSATSRAAASSSRSPKAFDARRQIARVIAAPRSAGRPASRPSRAVRATRARARPAR